MTGAPAAGSEAYLHSYLAPLGGVLARTDVTDIYVNRPGEIWLETLAGGIERHDAPGLDDLVLARLSRQIAALSHQGISRSHPLLSATLPGGERVQAVAPPATRSGYALAIRKHVMAGMSLADHVAAGSFAAVGDGALERRAVDERLRGLHARRDFAGLLTAAIHARRNILVSGGTSSGKTTFLNSLLAEIPTDERLLLIEDVPELQLRHENAVGLIAVRSALGEADVGADELLGAALRMRPDRIILGELRGAEAYAFLRAVNSGHPGSMTTVHADDPAGAVEQIVLLVLQAGSRLDRTDIRHQILHTIDVFVQMGRARGRRFVSDIVLRGRSSGEHDGGRL